jgi:hypothetical protein
MHEYHSKAVLFLSVVAGGFEVHSPTRTGTFTRGGGWYCLPSLSRGVCQRGNWLFSIGGGLEELEQKSGMSKVVRGLLVLGVVSWDCCCAWRRDSNWRSSRTGFRRWALSRPFLGSWEGVIRCRCWEEVEPPLLWERGRFPTP